MERVNKLSNEQNLIVGAIAENAEHLLMCVTKEGVSLEISMQCDTLELAMRSLIKECPQCLDILTDVVIDCQNEKAMKLNQSSKGRLIRQHLMSGKSLTQLEATLQYGYLRLGALVFDMRHNQKYLSLPN